MIGKITSRLHVARVVNSYEYTKISQIDGVRFQVLRLLRKHFSEDASPDTRQLRVGAGIGFVAIAFRQFHAGFDFLIDQVGAKPGVLFLKVAGDPRGKGKDSGEQWLCPKATPLGAQASACVSLVIY